MTPWTADKSSRVSFQNPSPDNIHDIAYSPVQSTPIDMSTDSAFNNSILGSSSNNNTRISSVKKCMFAGVNDENVNVNNNIGRRRKSSASSRCSSRKRKGTASRRRSRRGSVKEGEAQGYTLSGLVDGALTKITDVLFDNLGCDTACSGWMMDASTPSTCKIFTTQ